MLKPIAIATFIAGTLDILSAVIFSILAGRAPVQMLQGVASGPLGAVALTSAARAGLPVTLHTPSAVKAAVTGNGRADKAQVTSMVTRLLTLSERPRPPDAADALALAICQLWRGAAQSRLAAAVAGPAVSVAARGSADSTASEGAER